jgi:hypothetical protein
MTLKKRGETWHVWFWLRGKKTSRSTGLSNRRAAELRAKEIVAMAKEEKWAVLEKIKSRRTDPTIEKILEIYLRSHTCRRPTAVSNASCLRRVCLLGTEKPASACTLADLDRDAVLSAHRSFVSRGSSPDRGETSARTTLRKARSVFSRDMLPFYPEGVKNAAEAFLAAGRGIPCGPASSPGFVPIPPLTLRAIYRDMIRLRPTYPAAWRFFLLMARCGLSNREAQFARGTWLRGSAIHIPASDGAFRPKSKNRVRSIPIRPDRYRRYFSDLEGSPIKLVVNSLWLQRAILAPLLRSHLPDRQKGLYELRKHAGSLVATRDGIYAAARFLGDRVETAERFYSALLKPLRPL